MRKSCQHKNKAPLVLVVMQRRKLQAVIRKKGNSVGEVEWPDAKLWIKPIVKSIPSLFIASS